MAGQVLRHGMGISMPPHAALLLSQSGKGSRAFVVLHGYPARSTIP